MYGLNKVMVIGNLGRDVEVKETENTTIANFSVAINESYKKEGELIEKVEWVNVVLFGNIAKIFANTTKGTKVYIEGKLQTRSWENEEGKKQYRTEIVGRDFIFLSPKTDGAESVDTPDATDNPDTDLPF